MNSVNIPKRQMPGPMHSMSFNFNSQTQIHQSKIDDLKRSTGSLVTYEPEESTIKIKETNNYETFKSRHMRPQVVKSRKMP